ncbi:hypothetical protein F8M41_011062 [Gigaspora margarita]|uniref:BED-type domain-containing protein n=1 Tax=Gigaspora margarita TaxID=4874 RepID=A0A8H3X1L5_GIGMA|nr:hypothetical protein F8M41_011062 [Gigaspora margarita]
MLSEFNIRNTHEIHNYFYSNIEKTKLICNICNASCFIETCLNNLKKHFAKYHKIEYRSAIKKEEKRRTQIKEINQIRRKKNSNNLNTQNNKTSIIQIPKSVQVEDFNEDDYTSEEEIVDIIKNGQALPVIQIIKEK